MAQSVSLSTLSTRFKKALSANANTSSFPSKIPTVTEPTGSGIIELGGTDGGFTQNSALILPYGLGADNDGFSVRVLGWHSVRAASVNDLWVPVKLCELTCLMCAAVGIAGAAVLNTEHFCDTLAIVTNMGNAGVDIDVISPQDDTIGHFVLSLKGFQKIEITFDQTTNTPTMNALVALL